MAKGNKLFGIKEICKKDREERFGSHNPRDNYRRYHLKLNIPRDKVYYAEIQVCLRRRTRLEVLTHYGNGKFACVICGEERYDCLSIDHINGGGTKLKREGELLGAAFYCQLKKRGYPTEFRTLCMNCQAIEYAKRKNNRLMKERKEREELNVKRIRDILQRLK